MNLKKLEITNFRCFESLAIDFEDQLTVLVAENGVGKTAILDAIAVAIGPFIGGFDAGVRKDFKHQDARIGVKKGPHLRIKFDDDQYRPQGCASTRMESKYPVSLAASGMVEGQLETWSRELTGEKTQTTFGKAKAIIDYAKKLQQQVRADELVALPIVAYYGTGRLWKQTQSSNRPSPQSHSRLYGYQDALNPNSTYKAFEKWFTEKSLAEYHHNFKSHFDKLNEILSNVEKNRADKLNEIQINEEDNKHSDESSNYFTELDHVRKAINQCMSVVPGWRTLEYDLDWRELVVRFNHGQPGFDSFIPAAQLSDGVKAMLSLTADIAYRCVQLNPHLASPTEETNGIILIDEIDLHLHPKWQQTVLVDLCKAFPKIQFIVTTHSPQVLTTVQAKCIRLLSAKGDVVTPAINTYGEESKVALEDIMQVNSRPHTDETDLLQRYLQHINQGDIDSPEVMQWRQTLEQGFGSEYSKLKLADMVISKWKAKRGME